MRFDVWKRETRYSDGSVIYWCTWKMFFSCYIINYYTKKIVTVYVYNILYVVNADLIQINSNDANHKSTLNVL